MYTVDPEQCSVHSLLGRLLWIEPDIPIHVNLKGLSHEIDFKNFDKNLQNYGTRLVFEFFIGFNDFKTQTVYLLRLMPFYVGLSMVSCFF